MFLQRSRRKEPSRDRGSFPVLLISMFVGIFLAFGWAYAFAAGTIRWLAQAWFFLGIFLNLSGVAFRWYAIRVLGASFNRDVAVHAGQRVVQDGPYRYIRHNQKFTI